MNQLRDTHVGVTIKVLERLIEQMQKWDDGDHIKSGEKI